MEIFRLRKYLKENYVLFIALAIVLVIAATTYFYDFYTLTLMAQRVASGRFDLYSVFPLVQSQHFYRAPTTIIFNGPPLMYLLDGSLYFVFKTLHLITYNITTQMPDMLQLVALKLRTIAVFVLSYPLIKRVALLHTKDEKLSKRISNIWVASPLLLYLPFAQGNNDIYPAFISLLFLLFAFKRQYFFAMVSLGLMAGLKNYALFLILPAAIILAEKNIKKTIGYIMVPAAVYGALCLPYLGHINNFFGGGGEGLFILKSAIPSTIPYAIFPIAYFLVILLLTFSDNMKQLKERKSETLVYYMLLVTSLFTVTSYFYPQWVLWTLPFLVLVVYKNKRLFWLYILMTLSVFALTLTYFANYLDINMFRPILSNSTKYIHLSATSNSPALAIAFFVSTFMAIFFIAAKEKSRISSFAREYQYVLWSLAPTIAMLLYVATNIILSAHRASS